MLSFKTLLVVAQIGILLLAVNHALATGTEPESKSVAIPSSKRTYSGEQVLDLSGPPPVEPAPLALGIRRLPEPMLERFWSQVPQKLLVSTPKHIESVSMLHFEPKIEEELRKETFKQLLQHKEKKSIIVLGSAETDFGEKGQTVVFPLRSTRELKKNWAEGGLSESLLALVEVYPLKDVPFIYLLGFGRALPHGIQRLSFSFQHQFLAEPLVKYLRPSTRLSILPRSH